MRQGGPYVVAPLRIGVGRECDRARREHWLFPVVHRVSPVAWTPRACIVEGGARCFLPRSPICKCSLRRHPRRYRCAEKPSGGSGSGGPQAVRS